ncbi:MAG: C39 family peptidase [Patescibacteria group bacterium]
MRKYLVFLGLAALLMPVPSQAATSLAERLSGRVLLAVEAHGEAWYVDPVSLNRAFLNRPADAFRIMTSYGLGITNQDLNKIPTVASSSTGDLALRRRLAGRILLQVQGHGEAWYVDPVSLKRVFLNRPEDAFGIMTDYGLGITNANLASITLAMSSNSIKVAQTVPFTTQAPLGAWSDPRQQDGCEEAAVLMALAWAKGESLTPASAAATIIAMSDWEEQTFGYFQDTSIQDTATRLMATYSNFTNYAVKTPANLTDLIVSLNAGKIAIVPINGQVFSPFHYTPPGPARHVIVVHGYDSATQMFSVHDPGTSSGANLQVTAQVLDTAWRDYASGEQIPIPELPNAMIVVSR